MMTSAACASVCPHAAIAITMPAINIVVRFVIISSLRLDKSCSILAGFSLDDSRGGTNFLPISGVLACGEPQNVETLMRRGRTVVAVSWRRSMTRVPMTSDRGSSFGFASAHDAPIPYLHRIRTYYEALGYGAAYEWAHYASVPFHALVKPLSCCRLAVITTAALYQPDKG